jgi:hypothetical protein
MNGDNYIPLKCCIHLHTYASDGNASIEEICHAASAEGIDCVVITDHETLGHNVNGFVGDVLVITGEEITPNYSIKPDASGRMKGASLTNHLLALGIQRPIRSEDRSPQELIDLVSKQGGLSFLAHPAEPGHPWVDWTVERFTGFEIWTYKAAWKRGSEGIASKTYAWRNPDAVINGPAEEGLARWDRLGRSRRIVGLGSADNHAYTREIEGVERVFFPWQVGLSGIISYVWVEATGFAEQPVISFLDAVESGRLIIAHDGLFVARGFQTTARRKAESQVFLPGACIDDAEDLVIEVISPTPATLRILRDGELIHEMPDLDKCDVAVDSPGVWRVEAKYDGRPWVLANPFYVGLWSEQPRVSR